MVRFQARRIRAERASATPCRDAWGTARRPGRKAGLVWLSPNCNSPTEARASWIRRRSPNGPILRRRPARRAIRPKLIGDGLGGQRRHGGRRDRRLALGPGNPLRPRSGRGPGAPSPEPGGGRSSPGHGQAIPAQPQRARRRARRVERPRNRGDGAGGRGYRAPAHPPVAADAPSHQPVVAGRGRGHRRGRGRPDRVHSPRRLEPQRGHRQPDYDHRPVGTPRGFSRSDT